MHDPKAIKISDFLWELPEERIAKHPLENRDESKLLICENRELREKKFRDLPEEIPSDSLIVFNTTKVVRARLMMQRVSGATIEIFCTDSANASSDITMLLASSSPVRVMAFVGNAKRWKEDEELNQSLSIGEKTITLHARRMEKRSDQFVIELSWDDASISFSEILEAAGKIPLPPYIDRAEESDDAARYQTVYANEPGSVAAPTAGLHFTSEVLTKLLHNKVEFLNGTLHVGAGTFKPVKVETMEAHEMHREKISVTADYIQTLRDALGRNIIATGTTSLRTIESVYWFGRQLVLEPGVYKKEMFVGQWEPYMNETDVPVKIALNAILDWMRENKLEELEGFTQLLIVPGYKFRIANGLITNFHQPGSTLLLLVAAFIGEDWRKVYDYALTHDFRFLSYGDSSLLWRSKKS
ncbi:MAG TPA: S-adenosylmethionine:tRNA ribosyltransferase-isomerase [Bacteroidia bacterium]|jgi:S-adenosylmethionine:tRNA ribosyltransferase-isomerase|nr:S-adenosylmethionine:tRNA ribosyltransferase-isomerase [Bacteroidia bacterium]